MITIRWPWQHWKKPPPRDAEALVKSVEGLTTAKLREAETLRALKARRVVVVNNHIARDIHLAMERKKR